MDHDILSYSVPFFELNALKDIEGFKAISWRKGDLIVIKKKTEKLLEIKDFLPFEKLISFSRNPLEFRVFLKENNSLSNGLPPQMLIDYSKNISTRNYTENPDLWTTTKVGFQISDFKLIKNILTKWQEGKLQNEILDLLETENEYPKDKISLTLKILDSECKLWSAFSSPDVLKSPEDIIKSQKNSLSKFAISVNNRITKETSDGFRPPFSRDRDRLIWSSGFKRLADKTQLFPSTEDDSVRRRLTHTLEVQQLALTIGTSLGLNLDLIEACALAHDIGHTPFGHAGEYAIHKLLNQIHKNLNGFNHYEHGLDVLCFIESPYANDPLKNFLGLNVSIEVLEGVIKHTYHHCNNEFSSVELLKRSKHKNYIPAGYCHLEGQSVRIADKISYLISDIEDGLRLGAIDIFDLRRCQLFHISPLYFNSNSSEHVLQQYLRQRKSIIKILMEDVIRTSTLRISQNSIMTPQDARDANDYVINHSEEISYAVGEIWKILQANKLFLNRKVLSSNLLAAKIVSELVILFAIIPDLIETDFRRDYISLENSQYYSFYKDKLGEQITIKAGMLNYIPFHLLIGTQYPAYQDIDNVPLIDLLRSKDYIASLSDYKARKLHNQLLANEMK
jgi:dGTPase